MPKMKTMSYEVWREHPRDGVLAKFVFFQEALDYIEYANKRGSIVLLKYWNGKGWSKKLYKPNADT